MYNKEHAKPMIEAMEIAVDMIAISRAAATVVDGMPEEEFDKALNAACEKAYAKYEGLGAEDIMTKILGIVLRSDPSFILDLLFGGE